MRKLYRILVVLVMCILVFGVADYYNLKQIYFAKPLPLGHYLVIDIYDGDTIKVKRAGEEHTVRLIGVDTPELHHPKKAVECYALEARNYLIGTIGNNTITLKKDIYSDDKDIYGRLLRHVYINDIHLNLLLIQQGYAKVYTKSLHQYSEEFISAQESAINNQLGLHKACKST